MDELPYNDSSVSICIKLLHVPGLTGQSSGSAQLYQTIVRPYHHDLKQAMWKCLRSINVRFTGTWTVIGTACRSEWTHSTQSSLRADPITGHILEVIEMSNDCFTLLCTPGQWASEAWDM